MMLPPGGPGASVFSDPVRMFRADRTPLIIRLPGALRPGVSSAGVFGPDIWSAGVLGGCFRKCRGLVVLIVLSDAGCRFFLMGFVTPERGAGSGPCGIFVYSLRFWMIGGCACFPTWWLLLWVDRLLVCALIFLQVD